MNSDENKNYKIVVEVVGKEDQLREFIKMCSQIQALCSVGSSRNITVFIDGDGAANLKFNVNGMKLPSKFDKSENVKFCIGC